MAALTLTKSHYESLAAIRYTLRHFTNFSQEAARKSGLTPQQHQTLLAIKGAPGRDFVSIAELAHSLQLRHHSASGLVDRLVRANFVRRERSEQDRRQVEIHLTRKGETIVKRLSAIHLDELRRVGPTLRQLLLSL